MQLSAANNALIPSARSTSVEATLAFTKPFLSADRWLAVSNKYAKDVADEIARNNTAGNAQNGRHLAQYIAVSTLLHCSDGWSFLARSIAAMLNGDEGASLHLAYYAELRAAMSLLGTQGIGVFKGRHFVISGTNTVRAFPDACGTHDFVWQCLEDWSSTAPAATLVGELIAPYGIQLSSWVSPLGATSIIRPSARRWLKQWGMDLGKLKDDRKARNIASYRPSGSSGSRSSPADTTTAFVRSVWSSLELVGPSGFGNLDQYLLRSLIDHRVTSQHGSTELLGTKHKAIVTRIVDYQSLGAAISDELKDFLLRRKLSDDPLLFEYANRAPKPKPNWHLGVISRAVLLLRLATGATGNLFRNAGISNTETDFWRSQLGFQRGLWPEQTTPDPLGDIWADVEDNLAEFEDFEAQPVGDRTYNNLTKFYSAAVCELGKFERIAVLNL